MGSNHGYETLPHTSLVCRTCKSLHVHAPDMAEMENHTLYIPNILKCQIVQKHICKHKQAIKVYTQKPNILLLPTFLHLAKAMIRGMVMAIVSYGWINKLWRCRMAAVVVGSLHLEMTLCKDNHLRCMSCCVIWTIKYQKSASYPPLTSLSSIRGFCKIKVNNHHHQQERIRIRSNK